MNTIQRIPCHQMQFTCMDDLITTNNPVRIISPFVDKLDLAKLSISHSKAIKRWADEKTAQQHSGAHAGNTDQLLSQGKGKYLWDRAAQ